MIMSPTSVAHTLLFTSSLRDSALSVIYGRGILRILLTWGFAACAGMMVLSGVHPAGAGRRRAGPKRRAGAGLCLVPACGRRRAPWFWEITGYHTMQSPDLERSSPCRICRGTTG